MSRLIDSEKFDCVAFKGIPDGYKDTFADGLLYALNLIDDATTVDAVPVKHGKWVFSENDAIFYCTNCKNGSVRNDYPYCHWCGAKMDEVTE